MKIMWCDWKLLQVVWCLVKLYWTPRCFQIYQICPAEFLKMTRKHGNLLNVEKIMSVFFFTFSECLSVGVFPLFCPPPGFSAVSGGSISREDDGSFWQPVSSLLHDLTGPIRALRHLIPSMAAGEQEGEGWGWDGSLGGQRSSPGAEGFSSSSSSHSICLFLRREPGRFGQFFSWFVTFSPSSEKQLCDSLFLFWLDVMWRCWLLNNNGFASLVRRICQAQFPTLLSSPAIKTSTVRPASSPLILLLVVLLFSGSVRPPPVGSSSLI